MMARLHGFDWNVYAKRIMPAIASWIIEGDEAEVYRLYERTRNAQEERLLPPGMGQARTWKLAQAFVEQLPVGEHARREYGLLCSAEEFTALSDRYAQRHPPQLHRQSEALRMVWAALVEAYCLLPFPGEGEPGPGEANDEMGMREAASQESEMTRDELVTLLRSANLKELAQEISAAPPQPVREEAGSGGREHELEFAHSLSPEEPVFVSWSGDNDAGSGHTGIAIGRFPTLLHLRGWLAAHSVRAMALFELLACGRRALPFGYQAGEQSSLFIGYLAPAELWQLAACVRDLVPPDVQEARSDYQRFLQQQQRVFRMIDEVLPAEAEAFSEAVHLAAMYGWGLICSIS